MITAHDDEQPTTHRTGLSRVTEGCGRQTEMEAAGCEITGGAPTTLWVKGQIVREMDRIIIMIIIIIIIIIIMLRRVC